jgi:hypothetical protein
MTTQLSTLHLIGFRIEPDIPEPQLYTIYVDGDRPILFQGQPIVFTRPELAPIALSQSDCGASALGPAPSELYTVFDLVEAVYTLSEKDEETGSETLDVINVLLDFVNCTSAPMPEMYRSALKSLADHLTFKNQFADFLMASGIERTMIIDAIYWTLGMIVYHMKLITT